MSRGLHTLIDISNFIINKKNLEISFTTIKHMTKTFATNNKLNIVGETSKLFLNNNTSPNGWTFCYLLDESHISCHAYTNPDIGLCAIDIFTCCNNPIYHTKTVDDITSYLIENYKNCYISRRDTVSRFSST